MTLQELKREVQEELTGNIFPYWMEKMCDGERGGFYGRISGDDELFADCERGAILTARILWTFSAAYRVLGKQEYLSAATHAYRELTEKFYDREFGGLYWAVKPDGEVLSDKKQIYALGFGIYGLSEYYRVTKKIEALDLAVELFETIERYSFNKQNNGYFEALSRDWQPLGDMRLSDKDENLAKTMNTHLHILEPYTNLFRVYKDSFLEKQLRNLIELFLEKIISSESYHLGLFFEDDWRVSSQDLSYGHDIEAAWLLHEAAEVLGDGELLARVREVAPKIVEAASEGIMEDGSMIYEYSVAKNHYDRERHWWVQVEAIVGLLDNYHLTGSELSKTQLFGVWDYIKKNLIDSTNGEWHWGILDDGSVNRKDDKAGFWKCPYHNSRMCLEIIERDYE